MHGRPSTALNRYPGGQLTSSVTIPQWVCERAHVCVWVCVCLLPKRRPLCISLVEFIWFYVSLPLPSSLRFSLFLFPLSLSLQCLSPQISLLFINVYFNQAHFFANLGPKYCCIGQKFHKIVWKNPKELFGQCNISSCISQGLPHSILGELINNFHKQ